MSKRTKLLITIGLALALVAAGITWWATNRRSPWTVVGSMQQALGCASDWQIDCRATNLKADGGTFARTIDLPGGTHTYAVASSSDPNSTWGADGSSGARTSITIAGPAKVRFVFDPATHTTSVTPTDNPSDPPKPTHSLRAARTTEQFYFVLTDRFANGDASNDTGGLSGDRLVTGYDPTATGFYHGGDLAGIEQHLDYIQGLGTTAIWLTPTFANRPVQGSGDQASAGYHGYWITDFTRIDPHLGTNDDMKSLIDAVHARGMRLYFDIIVNHTADVIAPADGSTRYISTVEDPYTDASGAPFQLADVVDATPFPTLDAATSFPHVPSFPTEADRTVKVPAWLNDPTMYHNRGDTVWSGESETLGDFYGLDDLFTERPEVVDGFIDIYSTWADLGVDGFRIDTVKHVNTEFWQRFSPALQEHAKQDFFMFGEVYTPEPASIARYTTTGKLQAALDFPFAYNVIRFANSGQASQLGAVWGQDDLFTDSDSNAYQLPTFAGNHDLGRVGSLVAGYGTPADGLARSQFVHSVMFLTRGQPVVYYGDEQGFVGQGGDQGARQDMFASQVAAWNSQPMLGGESGSRDRYDTNHPIYTHIAALAKLRSEHPTLVNGAQIVRAATSGPAVVSRIGDDRVEYVVVANNNLSASSVDVQLDSRSTTLEPIFGGGESAQVDADGRTTLGADARSVRVYRASDPLPKRDSAPTATAAAPVIGGNATNVTFSAELSEPVFAQISFQARAAGASEFTILGTDDNPDYRVMADLSGYEPGTLLETRVVVTDAWDNVTATTGSMVVPA